MDTDLGRDSPPCHPRESGDLSSHHSIRFWTGRVALPRDRSASLPRFSFACVTNALGVTPPEPCGCELSHYEYGHNNTKKQCRSFVPRRPPRIPKVNKHWDRRQYWNRECQGHLASCDRPFPPGVAFELLDIFLAEQSEFFAHGNDWRTAFWTFSCAGRNWRGAGVAK